MKNQFHFLTSNTNLDRLVYTVACLIMRPDVDSVVTLLAWQTLSIRMTIQDCHTVFYRLRLTREGNKKASLTTSKLGRLNLFKAMVNVLLDVLRHVLLLYFMSDVEDGVELDLMSAWGIASRTFDSPARAFASASYGLFMIHYTLFQLKAIRSGGYGLGDLCMLETNLVAIDTV